MKNKFRAVALLFVSVLSVPLMVLEVNRMPIEVEKSDLRIGEYRVSSFELVSPRGRSRSYYLLKLERGLLETSTRVYLSWFPGFVSRDIERVSELGWRLNVGFGEDGRIYYLHSPEIEQGYLLYGYHNKTKRTAVLVEPQQILDNFDENHRTSLFFRISLYLFISIYAFLEFVKRWNRS